MDQIGNMGLTKEDADVIAEAFAEAEGEGQEKEKFWAVLLDPQGEELSARFQEVLKSIFAKFDDDKDGQWTDANLSDFFLATNGEAIDPAELEEAKDTFFDGEKMPLDNFIDMYSLQTC
eukprot:Ihof_evm4s472 gene=Ihof_evmTU4s472